MGLGAFGPHPRRPGDRPPRPLAPGARVRMEDGRIAEHWDVSDLASVWEQIGLV